MTTARLQLAIVVLLLAGCSGASKAPVAKTNVTKTTVAKAGTVPSTMPPSTLALGQTAPVETALRDPTIADAWRTWRVMIEAARKRLDIAQFYVSNRAGSRLEPVLTAIEAAAARGVRVRLLVEAKFGKVYPKSLERLAKHKGIEVRRWNAAATFGGGILHAKYFIVDGRQAWLGSQNFDWRALMHVQELGVRFNAPATVNALQSLFALDWQLAGGKGPGDSLAALPSPPLETARFRGEVTSIRLVASPHGFLPHRNAWDLPALVGLIDRAQRRVRIQLLSLHLHDRSGRGIPKLMGALRRAAKRGVEVQILLGHWTRSRRRIEDARKLQRIPGVTVKLLEIPQAKAGFIPFARVIHAKYLVADGRKAWLGTSNWAWGYFHQSRNVGLVIIGARFGAALDRFFLRGWNDPGAAVVDLERDYPPPRIAR